MSTVFGLIIQGKLPAKKVFARKVIRGGAIIQLAIIVTIRGLGFLAAFLTSLNCIPTTVGYIMKNRRMPMGIESDLNFRESINCPNAGRNLPASRPIAMHMTIQIVKYFSNTLRESLFAVFGLQANTDSFSELFNQINIC